MGEPRSKRQRRWSPEEILEELRSASNLSAKFNQRTNSRLYGAAVRCFGSWKKAVIAAGFDYPSQSRRKLPGYWSKERVIEEILKLPEKNSGYARKNAAALYNAALRRFESWKAALEAAGFDYQSVVKGWIAEYEGKSNNHDFRKK